MDNLKMSIINNHMDKIMILKIYVNHDGDDKEIYSLYQEKAMKCRKLVEEYLVHYFEPKNDSFTSGDDVHVDCGFDLFCPEELVIYPASTKKVNMRCKCAMTYMGIPCGFYLYPRSSVGAKTPLRLANSVGIIDSGYRGDCIAVFDNKNHQSNSNYNENGYDNSSSGSYTINKGDRLVQICSGNLVYPIYPIIVDSVEELGYTSRGIGGFGSTGR
jgi:dUTP pyrophosphatase